MYKLVGQLVGCPPEFRHIVVIQDEHGHDVISTEFANKVDAFDYMMIVLEGDKRYENYIEHPEAHIEEIYHCLSENDRRLIQNNLLQIYRLYCMGKYFR